MDPNYIESVLVLKAPGTSDVVRRWFEDRGFQVLEMRAGFLVTGSMDLYEKALGVDLKEAEPPVQLPVPRQLRKYVASFGIPKPRQLY